MQPSDKLKSGQAKEPQQQNLHQSGLYRTLVTITHLNHDNLRRLCQLTEDSIEELRLKQNALKDCPEALANLFYIKGVLLPELLTGVEAEGFDPLVIEFSVIRKLLRESLQQASQSYPRILAAS